MKFWSSEVGKMSIAAIVLLAAFPVSLIGLNTQIDAVLYLGLAMIIAALASAPIMTFLGHRKEHKD